MRCPVHNFEFHLIPAGFSKTKKLPNGNPKPYDAFWACPERGCTQKPVSEAKNQVLDEMQSDRQSMSGNAFNDSLGTPEAPVTPQKEEKVDWDAIALGKVRHGVVVAVIEHGGLEALKGQLSKINRVVDFIMTGEAHEQADDIANVEMIGEVKKI